MVVNLMRDLLPGLALLCVQAALLGLALGKPEKRLRAWTMAWGLLTTYVILRTLSAHFSVPGLASASLAVLTLAGLAVVYSCSPRITVRFLMGGAPVALLWAMWNGTHAVQPLIASAPFCVLLLVAAFLQWRSETRLWSARVLALVLLCAAAATVALAFHGLPRPGAFSIVVLLLGCAVLLSVLGQERALGEEHLVGLTTLNLRTVPCQQGSYANLLQALLERLHSILRVDHLALWAGPQLDGNEVALAFGFSESFQQYLKQGGGKALTELAPRFGGLIIGRTLAQQPPAGLLESEAAFIEVRSRLLGEGFQGFTCLSLQNQKQVFGVVILGHGGRRGLQPSQLRFLLAFTNQTSIALENIALVNQSLRRVEEFEILTHIGTALSSSLDLESLLRLIHAELEKLLDVRNFYIAFRSSTGNVWFELEVEDGIELAPGVHGPGFCLAEIILESSEPRLVKRAGTSSGGQRSPKSWVGVPITIYGKAAGVLAVQNFEREFAYDEDHLRVLEIVAGQAAVALENARLFADESRISAQFAFLNGVARLIVSTLDVSEMLSSVARETQQYFQYEYVGIGVVNYQTKEFEFRAEAGPLAVSNGQPRSMPLGVGLMGAAARTGQVTLLNEIGQHAQTLPLHQEAQSALALPIVFAGQTMGVLSAESLVPNRFQPEHVRVLQMLVDQLAAALNNAMSFQQMQHQSVTDGLTGLKTRRYFMEALQTEWKRASRNNRSFSIILVDLDNFKQLNDTMGHLEGDLALTRVARLLQSKCRAGNIVARFGGDEFTILLPETTATQARTLCERLRLWINSDPLLSERHLVASFGVAGFPEHGASPEEVLRAADVGMYAAKRSGGDQVGHPAVVSAALDVSEPVSTHPASHTGEVSDFASAIPALFALASALDAKDALSPDHSVRVAHYAYAICEQLGLGRTESEEIRIAARLHDIGKSTFSPELLKKDGLTPEDWGTLRSHASLGAEMVSSLKGGERVASYIASHHENFDGTGYPMGLKGDLIPLGGRIIAVAEAFESMTQGPRASFTDLNEALREMDRLSGKRFDPLLVTMLQRALERERMLHEAWEKEPRQ